MTSDVAGASVIARLGGGAAPIETTWRRRERVSRQASTLPDHWLMIEALEAFCDARVRCDLHELGLMRLELAGWLTRSLRRYAARNFSMEKTVRRDKR